MNAYQMLIGGEWKSNGQTMPVVSPANEEVIATVPVASPDDVQWALDSAFKAQKEWGRRSGVERGAVLRRLAELVERDKDRLARLLSQEQGKPLAEAVGEIAFGKSWLPYYAEFDRRIEGDILPSENRNEQIWIVPAPVGVVVGIIPWNFPSAVAIRKIAPALIAGNSIILKRNRPELGCGNSSG